MSDRCQSHYWNPHLCGDRWGEGWIERWNGEWMQRWPCMAAWLFLCQKRKTERTVHIHGCHTIYSLPGFGEQLPTYQVFRGSGDPVILHIGSDVRGGIGIYQIFMWICHKFSMWLYPFNLNRSRTSAPIEQIRIIMLIIFNGFTQFSEWAPI